MSGTAVCVAGPDGTDTIAVMPRTGSIRARWAALITIGVAALAPACAQAATTWHVTTAGDPVNPSCPSGHKCSLREAIRQAVNGDTIVVPAFHIHLSSQLDINRSITIVGAGPARTILDGGGNHRVISVIGPPPTFSVSNASLTLRALTVTGGSVSRLDAAQLSGGAGIQNNSNGTLHLIGVTVSGNTFTATGMTGQNVGGAGILSLASVDLASSRVMNNVLTVAGATGLDGGGGVLVEAGDLIAANSAVTGNEASITEQAGGSEGNGGGGLMLGDQGGDDVILEGTTIAGNSVRIQSSNGYGDGGGGLLQTGSVSVLSSGSTFSRNVVDLTADTGPGGGGAVLDAGSGSAYTNTTFAGNSVRTTAPATMQGGGAIFYALSTISSLANDTFAGNSPGGGTGANILDAGARVHFKDTIMSSGSTPAANCAFLDGGTVASDGYNIYDDAPDSCQLTGTGDRHATSPHLRPLASNGGAVQTLALQAGSPAINGADPHGCTDAFGNPLSTDARGVRRPQPHGRRCDVGAYEHAPPGAYTGLAGAVKAGTATLQGTASNPDALHATAGFQYGKTTKYGKTTAPTPVAPFSTAPVRFVLSNLVPGTYHYRLVVRNPDGTSTGADSTFVIRKAGRSVKPSGPGAPKAVTGPAESVTSRSAVLSGKLNGFGSPTFFEFKWGFTPRYGHTTQLRSAGSKNATRTVKLLLKNLQPGHTYHYELVVINETGRASGADMTFRTPAH